MPLSTYGVLLTLLLNFAFPCSTIAAEYTQVALPAADTHRLFSTPMTPAIYELPSGALSSWREYADRKPTLVLFSKHPMLEQIDDMAMEEVQALVNKGPASDIERRGRRLSADTLFLPLQTVSAAIGAGLIAELVYVLPTSGKGTEFSLQDFQKRAATAGFLTEDEALALALQDGVISGTLRGIPFRCVQSGALPQISAPVLVHIDLGYFEKLYANEIRTPVYDLIYQTATALRAVSYPALAVSLSYSNQEMGLSLDSRFIISDLADLARHPNWLDERPPASWSLRAASLYSSTMFAESLSKDLTAQAAQTNAEDPAALYHLAINLFQRQQAVEAFALLEQAIALDEGYALAYLDLADNVQEQGQITATIEMLVKAGKSFPENPFIKLRMADFMLISQRGDEAIPILQGLAKLPWSPEYHSDIPGLINKMLAAAQKQL